MSNDSNSGFAMGVVVGVVATLLILFCCGGVMFVAGVSFVGQQADQMFEVVADEIERQPARKFEPTEQIEVESMEAPPKLPDVDSESFDTPKTR